MIKLGFLAGILYTVHFFMLSAFTGSALNAIGVARSYVFYKITPRKSNTWILSVFIAIAGFATILTWQGLLSLLPFLGNSASGVAFWQKTPKSIRRWAMIPPPLWFTYNAISGSYPGMFIELVGAISLLVGVYRFDHPKHHLKRHLTRPN